MATLSFSELKVKADALFRSYIHGLYPQKVPCPTCGKIFLNEHLTIGHAFRRNELSLRYNPVFATLQCAHCNNSGVKDEELKDWFRSHYPGWDDLVDQERNKLIKRHELLEIIETLQS